MIQIYRSAMFEGRGYAQWLWSCDTCHYDESMPWRDAASFEDAWRAVDGHIALHRETGKRMEWIPVRD